MSFFRFFSNFFTKPTQRGSHLLSRHFVIFLTTMLAVIIIILPPTVLFVEGQQFFGMAAFDCRRIHPRYCCASRIRYSCPELCRAHPCNTPPAIQPHAPHARFGSVNKGGWPSPQALNRVPSNNFGSQQNFNNLRPHVPAAPPPFGLILPPEDTDLAKETPHSVNAGPKDAEEIAVLPDTDPSPSMPETSEIDGVNTNNEKSNLFPTLIPWGSRPSSGIDQQTPPPAPQEELHKVKNSNGAVDGESRVVGRGTQISQSRPETLPKKLSGVLKPPTSLGTRDSGETSDYDGLEALNVELHGKNNEAAEEKSLERIAILTTEKPESVQNIPPLPAHPETTWIPLKFAIKSSALNTSEVSRTTLTDNNAIRLTTPSPLRGLEEELNKKVKSIYSDEDVSDAGSPIKRPKNENSPNGQFKLTSPTSFSASFKRRGDLPIPFEGKLSRLPEAAENAAIAGVEKMWSKPNNNTNNNNNNFDEDTGIFGNKINVIIDHVITQETIDALANLTGRKPKTRKSNNRFDGNVAAHLSSSTASSAVATSPTTLRVNARTEAEILVSASRCGSAPEFRPCVEMSKANDVLLGCCRHKLMPSGCLELCRYDITQAEIKKAFDAGKCGILNVAPFLECASQGEDNLECCKHQNIAQKSGPQCEVFCNPKKGLGALGLQHLACQNVIGDLLKCHHSGLRMR